MSDAILLSGGIDSIALAYWKRPKYAFTIDYGQSPAEAEFVASAEVCRKLGIKHLRIKVDCSELGSGDLVGEKAIDIAPSTEWWPYRNQLLVTLASMRALTIGVDELIVGSVYSDGFHKDGTSHFYSILNDLMLYQEGSIRVTAPALEMPSVQLVLKSGVSPDILFFAHSCHSGNIPCGNCRGCNKYIDVLRGLSNEDWK